MKSRLDFRTCARWLTPCVVFLLAALGCGGAGPPVGLQGGGEEGPAYGGTLNVRVSRDPIDWDPKFQGRDSPGQEALAMAYNSLLSFKSDPGLDYTEMVLQPDLAQRWEVSPDGKTYTFDLRRGAKFADLPPVNGRELTSADVKFTISYYTLTGEFEGRGLELGRNAYRFEGVERVETPDRYTVRVQFEEPFVPFINYAASDWSPVLPREIFDQDGSFKERIAGTGLFQLDEAASQRGTRWVFKRNPGYWEKGKPYLDEVRWLVVNNEGSAFAALQTQQLHSIAGLAFQNFEEARKLVPEAQTFRYLQPKSFTLRVSQLPGRLTNDIRVRKAVSLSLDRDEINRVGAGGQGSWGLDGAMAGLFTEAEIKAIYKQDVVEARRLLAEAGYPNGITLEFPTDPGRSATDSTMWQLMQAQLKRAGIHMDIQLHETATQRRLRRTGQFDLDGTTGLAPLESDNDSILFGEFHSKFRGGSTNYSQVNDPELDRLLETQRREPDPEKRRELLRTAGKRIADQVWGLGTIYAPKWDLIQPYVKNYRPHFGSKAAYVESWIQK